MILVILSLSLKTFNIATLTGFISLDFSTRLV